jgi:MFS family permease
LWLLYLLYLCSFSKTKDMNTNTAAPPLFTASYTYACLANFLLNFSFYLIVPILPLYMMEHFSADAVLIGIVLSCFTITALLVRPFSGFLLDLTARKPLFLLTYLGILGVYFGYMYAVGVAMLISVRLAHGFFLGAASTASSTLVIDIMPAQRRGEGLGYFGMMSNLAMAMGPMAGMFLHESFSHNYDIIFGVAIAACGIGWVVAAFIKAPPKPKSVSSPLSLDRFILLKGLRGMLALMCMGVPYAMITGFIAIYTQELGISGGAAYFFLCFSAGIIASRMFAGKQVDRGMLTRMIAVGTILGALSFFLIGMTAHLHLSAFAQTIYFFAAAISLGLAYGMIFPAYNTLFVNLAHNNQRGTASSTYMTAWDIGIGAGLLLCGQLSVVIGWAQVYIVGAGVCLLSFVLFVCVVAAHFNKNKLR